MMKFSPIQQCILASLANGLGIGLILLLTQYYVFIRFHNQMVVILYAKEISFVRFRGWEN
jgi:hypothetical protein